MSDAAKTGVGLLEELRRLSLTATPESVSRDLDRARHLARKADPELRVEAEEYLRALQRLEGWLHDR